MNWNDLLRKYRLHDFVYCELLSVIVCLLGMFRGVNTAPSAPAQQIRSNVGTLSIAQVLSACAIDTLEHTKMCPSTRICMFIGRWGSVFREGADIIDISSLRVPREGRGQLDRPFTSMEDIKVDASWRARDAMLSHGLQ